MDAARRAAAARSALTAAQARLVTEGNTELLYLREADILLMTQAKGGTSSLLHWLFRGSHAGNAKYNRTACGNLPIQNMEDHGCWGGRMLPAFRLGEREQMRVLREGNATLRVAVQRDPYERLISCFKSKFACKADEFGTDLRERSEKAYHLRKVADLPTEQQLPCMNISTFAATLHLARARLRAKGDVDLRNLDKHYRPQRYFPHVISYDLVLNVHELCEEAKMRPLWRRLPFREEGRKAVQHLHSSGSVKVAQSEETERLLRDFAKESQTIPL